MDAEERPDAGASLIALSGAIFFADMDVGKGREQDAVSFYCHCITNKDLLVSPQILTAMESLPRELRECFGYGGNADIAGSKYL